MCRNQILIACMKLQKLQVSHKPRDKAILSLLSESLPWSPFYVALFMSLNISAPFYCLPYMCVAGNRNRLQSFKRSQHLECFWWHDYNKLWMKNPNRTGGCKLRLYEQRKKHMFFRIRKSKPTSHDLWREKLRHLRPTQRLPWPWPPPSARPLPTGSSHALFSSALWA